MTLQRHIAAGTIRAPKVRVIAGIRVRLWFSRNIERVRKQLLKFKPTNGRRKKKKSKK